MPEAKRCSLCYLPNRNYIADSTKKVNHKVLPTSVFICKYFIVCYLFYSQNVEYLIELVKDLPGLIPIIGHFLGASILLVPTVTTVPRKFCQLGRLKEFT